MTSRPDVLPYRSNKKKRKNENQISVAALYNMDDDTRLEKIYRRHKQADGVGPSPFTEQNYRVITYLAKDPNNSSLRAEYFEDCTKENWIPNVKDINNTYCHQQGDVVVRFIDPYSDNSRVLPIKSGIPFSHGHSSVTNIKDHLEIQVLCICTNPSAGRGMESRDIDNAATGQIGGTRTIALSGPFKALVNDELYAFKEAYTKPIESDPTGRSGVITCCPMRGLCETKLLVQVVPLRIGNFHHYVHTWFFKLDEGMHKLIRESKNRGQKLPTISEISRYNRDMDSQLNLNADGKIPGLRELVKLWFIKQFIQHGIHIQLGDEEQEEKEMWKSLMSQLYVVLAQLLTEYFNGEYKKLPAYWNSVEWKKKLPYRIEYKFEETKMFSPLPNCIYRPMTHLEHVLNATEHSIGQIQKNMHQRLQKAFIATALTGAEPTRPIDIDIFRHA